MMYRVVVSHSSYHYATPIISHQGRQSSLTLCLLLDVHASDFLPGHAVRQVSRTDFEQVYNLELGKHVYSITKEIKSLNTKYLGKYNNCCKS